MAIGRITIDFNDTMGQVTLRTDDSNTMVYDLDYKSELGQIVQEYYDEIRR